MTRRRPRLRRVVLAASILALLAVVSCEEISDEFVRVGSMRVYPVDPSLRPYSLGSTTAVQVAEYRITRARARYEDTDVDLLGGQGSCPIADTAARVPTADSDLPCELGIVVGESESGSDLTLDVTMEITLRRIEPLLFDRTGDSDLCPPDSTGSPCPDGVPNFIDRCPLVFDPGQEDDDRNGIGDACQVENPFSPGSFTIDNDADGIPDFVDNCPYFRNGDCGDAGGDCQLDRGPTCGPDNPVDCEPPYGIGQACPEQVATVYLDGRSTIDLTLTNRGFYQSTLRPSILVIDLNGNDVFDCDWASGRCDLRRDAVGFCVRTNLNDAQFGC